MAKELSITEADIEYIQYRLLSLNAGIAIEFKIKGNLFTRASMLKHIGDFNKNKLLWWKKGDNEYCDEKQSQELESIIKAFSFPERFKEQFKLDT